jgi:hypothetical protein
LLTIGHILWVESVLLVDLVVVVVVDMDFDGDSDGDRGVAAPSLTLRFRTSWSTLRSIVPNDPRSLPTPAARRAMIAVRSSTLAGHVAVAVKVHDDDHD